MVSFATMINSLILFSISLFISNNKISSLIFCLSSIILASLFRTEFVIYALPVILYTVVSIKNIHNDFSKFETGIFIVIIIILSPAILHFYGRGKNLGYWEIISNFPQYIIYVKNRFIDLFQIFFLPFEIVVLLFIIIKGCVLKFKKEEIILIFSSIIMTLTYIFYPSNIYHLEERYIAPLSPILFIVFAQAFYEIFKKIKYKSFFVLILLSPIIFSKMKFAYFTNAYYRSLLDKIIAYGIKDEKDTVLIFPYKEAAEEIKFTSNINSFSFEDFKQEKGKLAIVSHNAISISGKKIYYIHPKNISDFYNRIVKSYIEIANFIIAQSNFITKSDEFEIYYIPEKNKIFIETEKKYFKLIYANSCNKKQDDPLFLKYMSEKNYKQAILYLNQKLKNNEDSRLLSDRAVIYLIENDKTNAEKDFLVLIKKDPYCINAYLGLIYIYGEKNEKEKRNICEKARIISIDERSLYQIYNQKEIENFKNQIKLSCTKH